MFELLNSLLDAVQDIVGALFFSSSPDYKKKKELRRISAELRKLTPPLYRSDKTLLPAFATLLYQLYYYLQPIKSVLEKTIAASDLRASEKYQDMFFEASFTDEQKTIRQSFVFAQRNNTMTSCKNYEEAEHIVNGHIQTFKNFLKIFEDQSFKIREKNYRNLFFLMDLCNFDYASLLSYFNKNISLGGEPESSVPLKFQEVFAAEVLQNMLDFQFIIKHVVINADTIKDVIFLAKNIPDFQESEIQNIDKTLNIIETILAVHLKRTTIPLILKLVKEDPQFEEHAVLSETKPLQDYLQRLTETFQADSKRLLKIQKEQTITALIEKCFGRYGVKQLEGYNDTINEGIQNFSADAFDWIKPMQLLKSFTEMYFELRYKAFLQAVLVEGFFTNKQAEFKYSSMLRACEVMRSKIQAFEDIFKPDAQCSVQQIKQYITELEQGKDLKKQLHKIVHIANMQAKALVQTGSKAYMDLYLYINNMLEDSKKTTVPELITNLKSIASTAKNREAFAYLEQDHHIFALFLEIMKNYAVIGTIDTPAQQPQTAAEIHETKK
ncbi:MAG: DUF5312 family protein [Treponema sp.]